jgi:hypothetical protein
MIDRTGGDRARPGKARLGKRKPGKRRPENASLKKRRNEFSLGFKWKSCKLMAGGG